MRDILIVEDGLNERLRLEKLFASAKYSVSAAESATTAERLLDLEEFRLVILDIGLGDKSGTVLFEQLMRMSRPPLVIMLTGNPSVHLKKRLLEEGAADYIVKASPESKNENLLKRVESLLGAASKEVYSGIPLDEFLKLYVSPESRELFLDAAGDIPKCSSCGHHSHKVIFHDSTQLPPIIEGRVVCSACGAEMSLEVG